MKKITLLILFLVGFWQHLLAQVPGEPTNLVATGINTGGMIQFTAPASTGGSAITNYEYSTDNGASWVTPSPAVTTSPLIISSGLTNCTSYQVKIRAVNAVGSGAESSVVQLIPTTSDMGVIWTQRASAADNSWRGVTYGNGLFVAVAFSGTGNRVMTSPDGINWTARTSAPNNNWRCVTYGNGLFVAVSNSTGTGNQVMTSPDGITWTARTSAANCEWFGVTYGNGLFVAVASTGTNPVMTSPDGITWTSQTSAPANEWRAVTYGNGLFVAVAQTGTNNRVMTSADGITWIARTSAANNAWNSVTYGNGMYVAVASSGSGNRVMTSSDGINWIARNAAAENSWFSVTYGNGKFVAVATTGTGNRVMTSANGETWTTKTSAVDNAWNSVTYGNGLFVAVATTGTGDRVMTSSFNLLADAPVISKINARNNEAQVIFSNTASVLSPAISNYEYSTDDGSNWIARSPASYLSPFAISGLSNGTSYNIKIRAINSVGASCASTAVSVTPSVGTVSDAPTNLVATGINSGGMIQFSAPAIDGGSAITNYEYSIDNGSTWVTPSPVITSSPLIISSGLTNCTSYQVKLRAVNSAGNGTATSAVQLIPTTSLDMGVNWTQRASTANNEWTSVNYGNGIFVAVAQSGAGSRVMSSSDGINWTARTASVNNQWVGSTFGNGLFIAVSNTGTGNRVMTSSDGITWKSQISSIDNEWRSVTYGNGLFVAVSTTGTGNRVMTSPDGINWTTRSSVADNDWRGVTYGNGRFVAVSSTGTNRVMTSSDGINWTIRNAASNEEWRDVTFGNGLFVAVATSGTGKRVMTSTDGITWISRSLATNYDWRGVTYGNGLFVVVGNSTGNVNQVITSPDGINWTSRTSAANNSWVSVTYGNGVFVAVSNSLTGNLAMTSSFSVVANAPAVSSATFGNSNTVSFTQSASALSSSISNYEYSTDNGSSWTALSPASTTSPLTITGLATMPSSIMIRAVNSVGSSCPSNNFCVTPTPPTASAQTFIGSKTIADLVASGTDLKWYDVATNGTALTSTTAITTGTYYVSQTLNSCESARTSVAVTVTPITLPGTPTNLVATGINTGGMIQFTAPTSDGGSPITNYEYSIDNGSTWVTPSPAITSSPLIISSGLTNCTSYQVKIRAVNAVGRGTASAAVQLIPATSVDMGVNWTARTSATGNGWRSITYGNGLFVAVAENGNGNRVMTSPDGITWTSRTSAADNYWNSVTYGNGLFVAVASTGTGNRVMTSPDGITWTAQTSAADNSWNSVTYGNGLFVAVAQSGAGNRVMTSDDGINWTIRTSAANNSWSSVTHGNGKFVAVASSGTGNRVMTSPDGITWTAQTSAVNNNWNSVTYGDGRFVAVAPSGTGNRVMTSPDGITWTAQTSAVDNLWSSVTYGNGLFVAVSINGLGNRVMTSPDGITWTARTSAADNLWWGVTYGNGRFVAVASTGTGNRVMTSDYSVVADAPVIISAPVSQSEATVSFTQSASALSSSISNYEYSTNNSSNWVAVSPAATTSPLTITGLATIPSSIMIRAVNSVGSSCPASYTLVIGLNKYGQKTTNPSEFVNKNGAIGISGILATGESIKSAPVITATAAITNLTSTSATSGGTVSADGGASVTARGVCWSTTANPTIANSKQTYRNGTGTFTSAITGLVSGTTYYIRSYATNSVGTTYGPQVSFTTL